MDFCPILSNPDIAGLGVRIATYLQATVAFLASLFTILYCFSRVIQRKNPLILPKWKSTLDGIQNGLFISSASVVISTMIQADSKEGLRPYHALVAWYLSQLNTLSLLYMALNDAAVMELIAPAECDTLSSTTSAQKSPVALHYLHHGFVGSFGLYYWSDKSRYEGTSYSEGVECRTLPLNTPDRKLFIASSAVYLILSTGIILQRFPSLSLCLGRMSKLRHILATILGCCFIPFFIIMMEDTIQDTEEDIWSYGQILALVTALMSVLMLLGEIARIPRVFKTAGKNVTRSDIDVSTWSYKNALFDSESGVRPDNCISKTIRPSSSEAFSACRIPDTVDRPSVKPKRTMTAPATIVWPTHTAQAHTNEKSHEVH